MESLDTINEHQRRILNEYQAITHAEDIDDSIRILVSNDWNLESAVQNRYIPSNTTTNNPHATTIEDEDENNEGSPDSTSALLGHNNRTTTARPSRFMSLFMWPFNLAWKLSWNLVQFTARLLYRPSITSSAHNATRRNDPRYESDRFLRDFESTYGTIHPTFFEGSYTQALSIAKRDLKYLLVLLSSEEHDDTARFLKDTLTNPELIDFLNQHQFLFWAGNVRYTEAFQVSNTLQATTYPFLAIIALHQSSSNSSSSSNNGASKMTVIDRMEGPVTPATILRRFDSAMTRVGNHLNHLRMEREQRELERRLRQEQDSAYRASLKADQEKERQLELKRQQAQLRQQKRLQHEKNKQLYIQYLVQTFSKEEEQGEEGEKMTKISFRLANGDRVIRKFKATDTLERLYQFVEVYPHLSEHPSSSNKVEAPKDYTHKFGFTVHSPFPRTIYQPDATILIGDEKGLWPSATMIVDTIDDEGTSSGSQDEEEEED